MSQRIRSGGDRPSNKRLPAAAVRLPSFIAVCLLFFLFIASQSLGVTATRYIRSNGGDCASIGSWDQATKTCTLSGDLAFTANGIVIDGDGITLDGAGHTITGAGGFTSGVSYYVKSNIVVKNLSIRQFRYGVNLLSVNNAIVDAGTFNANTFGAYLQNRSGTQAYGNSFNGNTTQAVITGGSGNVFNLGLPVGGNWWSNYDTPAEGCSDVNSDGFCDTAYSFSGGIDSLPRVLPL